MLPKPSTVLYGNAVRSGVYKHRFYGCGTRTVGRKQNSAEVIQFWKNGKKHCAVVVQFAKNLSLYFGVRYAALLKIRTTQVRDRVRV